MNDFENEDKPHGYRWDLDHQLLTIIDNFEEGRIEHWGKDTYDPELVGKRSAFEDIEKFATELLKGSDTLIYDDYEKMTEPYELMEQRQEFLNPIDGLRDMWIEQAKTHGLDIGEIMSMLKRMSNWHDDNEERPDDDSHLKILWERLIIDLARDAIENKLIKGTNRLLRLVDLFMQEKPQGQTVDFLRRISRCYIWGFDPECVILCRSALDTAFKDKIHDKICKKYRRPAARYGYTLAQRINAAEKENMISSDRAKKARAVNGVATETVHDQPDITRDSLKFVKMTLAVIQQLYGSK